MITLDTPQALRRDTPRLCAALAQIAYQEPAAAAKACRRLGLTWTTFYDVDGSQALLGGDGYRVYFSARGTNELIDLLRDLRYVKVDFPGFAGGRVHRGFLAALMRIWPAVEADLRRLDPTMPRIFTGHSLGAAMAVEASGMAEDLVPEQVHVFGCPRVGNRAFVAGLRAPIVRYENWADVVTFVPPPTSPRQILNALRHGRLPSLYRHAGVAVQLPTWRHAVVNYRIGVYRYLDDLATRTPANGVPAPVRLA